MAFPRKGLNSYEEIVLDLNPHWSSLLAPAAAVVAAAVVAVALAALFDVALLAWLGIALVVVAALFALWRFVTWRTTHFVVTSDRLIYQAGVVAKRGIQIPLERVNNVNFHQSVVERMVGAGDLLIESGGESGQQRFTDIKRPGHVQNVIHAEVEANENRKFDRARPGSVPSDGDGDGGTPLPPPRADMVGQLERLEGLRQRGVLNQAEFDEQKAKLLGP